MKLLFSFQPEKCSACGACAIACMDQNDVAVEHGQQPYRKVYAYERPSGEFISLSVACLHCADAPCIAACPVGCLYKEPATGLTLYHNDPCIGCHSCAAACPYDAPSFRPPESIRSRDKMEKCDGCAVRVSAGLAPACVHACPTGALTLRWAEDTAADSAAELYRSCHG